MPDQPEDGRVPTLLLDLYREGAHSPPPMPTLPASRRPALRRAAVALVTAAAVAIVAVFVASSRTDDRSIDQLTPAPTAPATGTATQDPLRLIGLWTVHTPAEKTAQPAKFRVTALRLAGGDYTAFTTCGAYLGSWLGDAHGRFVADTFGTSGACVQSLNPAEYAAGTMVPWLSETMSYTVSGADVVLYDSHHRRTARLTPGAHINPRPDLYPPLTQAPKVDAAARAQFRPARTPDTAGAAFTLAAVTGRWLPSPGRKTPQQAYLQLSDDGSWEGLDGCNGLGGRWLLEPKGRVLAAAGGSTLIGCNNVNIPMGAARSLRLIDGKLLLYDVDAHLLATFVRG